MAGESINYPSHINVVSIVWDGVTSHTGVIEQLVDGLVKQGFADRTEILDHLEEARTLIDSVKRKSI